ncbi:hypothetical protein BC828DRAFT_372537 [Blastocladiella britannica]|nr:hypothetical protein BC828DRAFT_372537 [Blastocladiella britannica]
MSPSTNLYMKKPSSSTPIPEIRSLPLGTDIPTQSQSMTTPPRVSETWFTRLHKALLYSSSISAVYFVFVLVHLITRVFPLEDGNVKNHPEISFAEGIATQYWFAMQVIPGWKVVAVVLSALGLLMSGVGFVAFVKRSPKLVLAYISWAAIHAAAYIVVFIITIVVLATSSTPTLVGAAAGPFSTDGFTGTADAWIVLLSIMIPDVGVWTVIRAVLFFAGWVYCSELRIRAAEAGQCRGAPSPAKTA